MNFKIKYVLSLCLISCIHQYMQASSSSLRRTAATITPAIWRTSPSLQQTASYWTHNTNPDGSEESNKFNDENKQLEYKTIKYPDNTKSSLWYLPNGTIESIFTKKNNGNTSYSTYNNNGKINKTILTTKYPNTYTALNDKGNTDYITTKLNNDEETTDIYTKGLKKFRKITYPDNTNSYINYSPDGSVKSESFEDNNKISYVNYNKNGEIESEFTENKDSKKSHKGWNSQGYIEENEEKYLNNALDLSVNKLLYSLYKADRSDLDEYGRKANGKLEDLD